MKKRVLFRSEIKTLQILKSIWIDVLCCIRWILHMNGILSAERRCRHEI